MYGIFRRQNLDEELSEYKAQPRGDIWAFLKQILVFIFSVVFVILLGIYMGNVLFGRRSLEVLQNLQKEKAFLYRDVERLKSENAELQKRYLEYKSLDPDMKK